MTHAGGGLAEVGARLVLLGKEAYIAGMREAEAAQKGLAAQTKATAEAEKGASAASKAAIDAKMKLAEANRQGRAATREYETAVRAQARAEAEAAAVDDEAAKKKAVLAKARTDAALAAKTASEREIASAKASADAATLAADKEIAARKRVAESSSLLASTAKTAFFGVAAVAGVATIASAKMAGNFEADTTRFVTSGGEAVGALDQVRKGMLDLAPKVGVTDLHEMAATMYTIESAGYHGAAGLGVLKAAEQGARAEGADAKEVADALSSALRDYYPHAKSAAEVTKASNDVMSKFIGITSAGKLTFQEMASALHSVLPAAANAGISLQDIGGALAAMTVHGYSADQATQNLAHAIGHLQGMSDGQAKELWALGISAQQVKDDLGKQGLTGTMQEIGDAIRRHMGPESSHVVLNLLDALKKLPPEVRDLGRQAVDGTITAGEYTKAIKGMGLEASGQAAGFATLLKSTHGLGKDQQSGAQIIQTYSEALKKATGDQTGMNVALMLGGENAEYTSNAVRQVAASHADAKGDVAGFAEVQKTANFQLDQFTATSKVAGVNLGATFLPVLVSVAGVVKTVAEGFAHHTGTAHALIVVIGILVGLYAVYAATVKTVALVQAAWAVGTAILTGEFWALDAALVANPIGLIVVAIVALVGALVYAWNHWSGFRTAVTAGAHAVATVVRGAWNGIKAAAVAVWGWLSPYVHAAIRGIVSFFRPMVNDIKSHWGEIKQVASFVWHSILVTLQPVITGVKLAWTVISGAVKLAVAVVVAVVRTAWNVIWSNTKVTFDIIVAVLRVAWNIVVMVFKVARDIIMGVIIVLLDLVTGHWKRAWIDIKDFGSRIWHDIWDGIKNLAGGLWNDLKRIWNDMKQGAKDIFFGLWHDLKHVFVVGANAVIDIVNGFLGVVNKIAGAVGFKIDLHVPHVPELAQGGVIPVRLMATGGVMGDFFTTVGAGFVTNGPRAIVGEGGPHPEYVIPTDPQHRGRALGLFADLSRYLMPGVPGYDIGGVLGDVWGGITSAAGTVGHAAKSAADWVGDVAAAGLRKVIESQWPQLQVPGGLVGLVPAEINTLRTKALDWLDAQYVASGNYGGSGGAAPPGQVHDWIMAALGILGYPGGYAAGIYHQIMTESGGRPGIVQQIHDVNSGGNEARGIMQVIPPTFARWALPGHGNIFNPVDNIIAGSRYAMARYGAGWFNDGPWHSHGYASGGVLPAVSLAASFGIPTREIGGAIEAGQPYLVGESGPEIVVPAAPGIVIPPLGSASRADDPGRGGVRLGGDVHLGPVTIYESGDPQKTYEQVRRAVGDALARR